MPTRYILGTLTKVREEKKYLCKDPSDGGPFVFVGREHPPASDELFLIKIIGKSRRRKSRHGCVLWSLRDTLTKLEAVLAQTAWTREQDGEVWARSLQIPEGDFDAHYFRHNSHSVIAFVPAQGSILRSIQWELSTRLQCSNVAALVRAETVYTAP